MGCFSWRFADKNNKRRLKIDRAAYVMCPDGGILYEPCYNGYGDFAGKDIYDLVADWNRKFLSQNPDFVIKSIGREISSYNWYLYYANLEFSPKEIERRLREDGIWNGCTEYRDIGICIACEDEDNAALPYPIKICQSKPVGTAAYYQGLPASEGDPYQGCD